MFGKKRVVGRGYLPVRLGLRTRRLYGGPFAEKPKDFVGIKMAAEIDMPCDIDIPTQDFQTPNKAKLLVGVAEALHHLALGEKVYVGCMGGQGRTGLFMAVLAKALGEKHPVSFVREHYLEKAVENTRQEIFVGEFDVSKLRLMVDRAKKLSNKNWYRGLIPF